MKTLGLLLVAALAVSWVNAVDRNNFKTCDQSGFCKRLRAFKPENSQYTLNLDTVLVHGNVLSAEVQTIDTESDRRTVLVSLIRFIRNYNNFYDFIGLMNWVRAKLFLNLINFNCTVDHCMEVGR